MGFEDWFGNALNRRYVGLPLRMVWLCDWHRIHGPVALVGSAGAIAGRVMGKDWLLVTGLIIALPSLTCLLLVFPLGLTFLALSKLFPSDRQR